MEIHMKKKTAKKRAAEAPAKNLSGLDAAHNVLLESKVPMNATQILDRILAEKLWTTSGKTPHATIYAAMLREIQTKGDASRFRKAERGRFSAA
jgi:hypothetical protein